MRRLETRQRRQDHPNDNHFHVDDSWADDYSGADDNYLSARADIVDLINVKHLEPDILIDHVELNHHRNNSDNDPLTTRSGGG